jgi:hypothetical protein
MLILTLAALTLFVLPPQAHAVKDLFSLCERQLTINSEIVLQLKPNQIAFQGQLDHFWETGMKDQVGWLIHDKFLQTRISPNQRDYSHWLSDGDQVFILNEMGDVTASGFFSQEREKTMRLTSNGMVEGYPNLPRLFNSEGTVQVMDSPELSGLFLTNARAVVIHTQTSEQTTALQTKLKPWFNRYVINSKDVERFVRVGRRRAYELAHFEVVHKGHLLVEGKTGRAREFDFASGSFTPGDRYRTLKYFLLEGESRTELRNGEQIFLLDRNGLVLQEGRVGSVEFPQATGDLKKAATIEAQIRSNSAVSVVRFQFRDLKK